MVVADLRCRAAERLEEFRDRQIGILQALLLRGPCSSPRRVGATRAQVTGKRSAWQTCRLDNDRADCKTACRRLA